MKIEEAILYLLAKKNGGMTTDQLTARLDSAKLPDGRLVPEYYVLEYPDWINVT